MTIISNDIDAGSNGTAVTLTDFSEQIFIKSYVVLIGEHGITDSIYSGSTYYDEAYIHNDGHILSNYLCMLFNGSDDVVFNGRNAAMEGDFGLQTFGDNTHIVNEGSIHGKVYALILESDDDTIINAGILSGGRLAIDADYSSTVTLRNTGSIIGDVKLYAGANMFDGRCGTLNGTIVGGMDADVVRLGADGEAVRGGDGADTIYAGTGADTIIMTHLSASDVDHIHHFAAGQDTFQLEHSSFGKLAVGGPVAFAVGSKATSAADHLFYNSSSGSLFYDADGSGTKSKAALVAHLDTGLHLTANNFEVVPGVVAAG